jgi:hypothetical protein
MIDTIRRIEQIIDREPSRFRREQMRRQLDETKARLEGMRPDGNPA